LPMLQRVEKAAELERKSEMEVLAGVDEGSEDEDMSE
jgi:hypothetical protein